MCLQSANNKKDAATGYRVAQQNNQGVGVLPGSVQLALLAYLQGQQNVPGWWHLQVKCYQTRRAETSLLRAQQPSG